MKITTQELLDRLPVKQITFSKLVKTKGFPEPIKVGNRLYWDWESITIWLNDQCREGHTFHQDDKAINSITVQAIVGRSSVWVWSNLVKNPDIQLLNLSPACDTSKRRNYFIEREIQEVFPDLIQIAQSIKQAA